MDKLLIVEDETLIRQGLRAIIQRSGVPVDQILECCDGLQALELLRATPIDVMFTDVRMPEMDGLTLISHIQDLPEENRPLVVVISGHDDFNYAVEAMRYGSREYILKPVKRERVKEVLEKLEEEVARRRRNTTRAKSIGQQQLKYVLLNANVTDDELDTIRDTFRDLLDGTTYMLYCTGAHVALGEDTDTTQLDAIGPFHIMVRGVSGREAFQQVWLSSVYAGASAPHSALEEFRAAFIEAVNSRKHAFFTSKGLVEAPIPPETSWEGFSEVANPRQLVRKVGTSQYASLIHTFSHMFTAAAQGKLAPTDFEAVLNEFLDEACILFARLVEPEDSRPSRLRAIYGYDTVDVYRLAFTEWLDQLHTRVARESDNLRNRERMETAVAYVQQHYQTSLNMAVVSNHLSMNYSQFSHLFKEHTGQAFSDYLRGLRMEKACRLLSGTELRVSEIAAQVGYDDEKHFMKSFKATVGVSPTQYRKTEGLAGR